MSSILPSGPLFLYSHARALMVVEYLTELFFFPAKSKFYFITNSIYNKKKKG